MRIILTGGTGMIGQAMAASLLQDGHEVIILTRSPNVRQGNIAPAAQLVEWDAVSAQGWGHFTNGADVIINMAGERIAGPNPLRMRWSEKRKRRICESRANAGKAVTQAIEKAEPKPGLLIQFSGADYYPATSEHATEQTSRGEGFLAHVCADCWEPSTEPVEALGVRRAVVRLGPVLHPNDGALPPLAMQSRLFLGGPLGSGKQGFSWIHIDDVVGALRFLIDQPQASGVFNLTAPQPLTNAEFIRILGRVLGRPALLPVPAFALKLVLGEMASTLLQGPMVYPQRLQDLGFTFKFPDAELALKDLLG